jgi:CO/xanthine dehydrogenase Mo-binding subunit
MAEQRHARGGETGWTATGTLAQANQIDDWIAIEKDGTIIAKSGKVELGTGVETALAQIVAEELDVSIERVRMVMGDTELTPDEGYTAGSRTIQTSGLVLRHASAEARRALIEMASDKLDASPAELIVRDGVIAVSHHPTQTISYAELIGGEKFNRPITLDAPTKKPDAYRIVGQPVRRVDLPRKFTGAPSFVHDVRVPGMLHARVVRPPSPYAKLISLDENSVRDARVVRIGNFVGVVAEREEQAVLAAKQLRVTWEEKNKFPMMNALRDFLTRQPTQDQMIVEQGEVDASFDQAITQINATYFQTYQAHASIGPSCAVADYRDDQVTVWSATQGVFPLRGALADLLQLPPEKIRVIHVEGAGCYGHNGADDVAADAVILSRAVGEPVRVQWSREDEFAWEPYAPAMVLKMRGGLDANGNIIAWEYQGWTPSHANRPRAAIQLLAGQLITDKNLPPSSFFFGGDRNAPTNYRLPNQRVTMHWLRQSPLRVSSFRGLGAGANTFANESFIDELAVAAQVDPLEFRLRHLDDPRAHEVLRAAAQHANWGEANAPNEGKGIAFVRYENREAYVATVAHVQVDPATGQVRVKRIVAAHDCGLIINPDGVKNQIEGNILQATSRALFEQVTFDETRITSRDWETYPILKFSDAPDIDIVLLNRPTQPSSGAGEPATVTIAAAIANAIFNASGVRLREVPLRIVPARAAMDTR